MKSDDVCQFRGGVRALCAHVNCGFHRPCPVHELPSKPGGAKLDAGKPDLSLLVWLPTSVLAVCRVFRFGGSKYAPLNYRKGFARTRLIAACLRHVFSYLAGEDKDPETGESHLANAVCGLLMTMQNDLDGAGEDDREKRLADMWRAWIPIDVRPPESKP